MRPKHAKVEITDDTGTRWVGIFFEGTDRCVSLKQWVKAGLGHWRQAEMGRSTKDKGFRAVAMLRAKKNETPGHA